MDRPLQYLQFSGKEEDFAVWQERFEGFCFTKKMLNVLNGTDAGMNDKKYEIWAYLVQCLDSRSILMLTNDCKGDGPKAWQLLRDHFNSTETPRLMNLLEKFTTLRLEPTEIMVDYLTRAEYVSKQLELAGEKVSENMLTSIVLKGLPFEFDYFKTVHDFSKDKASFAEVKKALKNFESSRNLQTATASNENVALLSKGPVAKSSARKPEKFNGKCRRCGKSGHKQATCRVSQCNFCRRFGHEENKCFKKNPLLNPKSSAETGESNLAEDLVFFCDGSETALTSQKCEVKEHTLVIDSGASSHMFFDRSLFFDFSEETQRKVKNANGTFSQVEGVGKVSLLPLDKEGIECCVTFSDCLFLPDHSHNLISVSKLTQNGAQVNFGKSLSIFVKERATILFEEHANLHVLKGKTFDFCSFSGENEEAVLWHHGLGHNNFKNVKRLAHHVSGMSLKHSAFDKLCCCEVCKISKSRRQPVSRKMEKRKSSKLDLVFTDILGPMPTTSLGGNRYAISFTDSYSRYSAVYFLKSNEECLDKFKVFCAQVGTPRAIRSDNGKEYISKSFRSFCISNRIKREHTAPYSPHQNGVSERRWRTTVEMARCMLKTAKLGNEFWVRALHTAFYISNRCLTVSLPKGNTKRQTFR